MQVCIHVKNYLVHNVALEQNVYSGYIPLSSGLSPLIPARCGDINAGIRDFVEYYALEFIF